MNWNKAIREAGIPMAIEAALEADRMHMKELAGRPQCGR
jgi:hypothetical protein